MARRWFTPAQANRTLPLVKRIVADILGKGTTLREIAGRGVTDDATREQVEVLEVEIRELIRELHAVGCQYKDWGFERGLVDFPAKIGGKSVLLCWRSDEPEVGHFHEPAAGDAGREPIPRDLLEDGGG